MIIRKLAPDYICTFATQRCYPLFNPTLSPYFTAARFALFSSAHPHPASSHLFSCMHHIHVIHISPVIHTSRAIYISPVILASPVIHTSRAIYISPVILIYISPVILASPVIHISSLSTYFIALSPYFLPDESVIGIFV